MKLNVYRDIKPFLVALQQCSKKSDFDSDFLKRFSAEDLGDFHRQQWLSVYKARRSALKSSVFCWTQYHRTVNDIWLNHARKVGRAFLLDILDLMLPDENIDEKDKKFIKLNLDYDFVDLYTDDTGQLRSFARFVCSYEPEREAYDEHYKLSICEADQIKYKCDWNYLCQKIMPIWRENALNVTFKDIAYPIFSCVTAYFSLIQNTLSDQDTAANRETIRALIGHIYSKQLIYLDPTSLYAFYAQMIPITADSQMEMIGVLLECRNGKSLEALLPFMKALAEWVSLQNPAMIIKHDALDSTYQVLGIGPYCSRRRICLEVDKLLLPKYDAELDSSLKQSITHVSNLLSQHDSSDEDIFSAIEMLNIKFDDFNGRARGFRSPSRHDNITIRTNDYVYNQTGINAQMILINQLLSGWGFLERHGVACYYRYMMNLQSDIDPISSNPYSFYPLSHCIRPTDDRRYLAILDNSATCYEVTEGIFENVNANPQRPFTEEEWENIQRFSAPQFQQAKYQRIAEYPVPPIKKSYLNMISYLVNNSLNFKGLIDGYRFELVWDLPEPSAHQDDVIYVKVLSRAVLRYSVKDRWEINSVRQIYQGCISTYDDKLQYSYFDMRRDEDKLHYILNYTGHYQHTRPNYSQEQLTRANLAYTQTRQKIETMPETDKRTLYATKIRLGNEIITFGELWSDGFPTCMSYASKGFAVLLITYFRGKIRFVTQIEDQSVAIGRDFLEQQRQIASARRFVPEIIDDTKVFSLSNRDRFFNPSNDVTVMLQRLVVMPDFSNLEPKSTTISKASTRASSFDSTITNYTSGEDSAFSEETLSQFERIKRRGPLATVNKGSDDVATDDEQERPLRAPGSGV